MKRLISKFNSISLRYRLLMLFAFMILAASILHSAISAGIMEENAVERYESEMNYRSSQVVKQVDDLFIELRDIQSDFAYNREIQSILENNIDESQGAQPRYTVERILLEGKSRPGLSYSAYVYDQNGTIYTSDYLDIIPFTQVIANNETGNTHLYSSTVLRSIMLQRKYDSLIIGRPIFDVSGREIIGTTVIKLNIEYIQKICKEAFDSSDANIYIFDSDGKLITSNTESKFDDLSYDQIINDNNQYVFNCDTDSRGWNYVAVVQKSNILDTRWRMQRATYLILALVIILMVFAFVYISTHVVTPINKLKKSIDSFEDTGYKQPVVFTPKYNDEIGQLARSYNNMTDKLMKSDEYIKSVEAQKQQAEVKMYQSQISPHFLYNTLSSIVWMVYKDKKNEAIEMTESLARFYQTSLSKGREYITVEEEFSHVESYLKIQEKRYKGVFEYTFDMDTSIADCLITKVILQPFVENSIYHGVKELSGDGIIIVRGSQLSEDRILLEVIDNGGKLTENKCREINEAISGNDKFTGIGISNVVARLKLYYGNEFSIRYMISGNFTIVAIELPRRGEEKNV